jgi:hypothetical protein
MTSLDQKAVLLECNDVGNRRLVGVADMPYRSSALNLWIMPRLSGLAKWP